MWRTALKTKKFGLRSENPCIYSVGATYVTSNIEGGEYSYVQEAGSKDTLEKALMKSFTHFKLDIRFEDGDYVVLVETKQKFVKSDEDQLREYLEEERALHAGKKIICILANTKNDKIKVWRSFVDDYHYLSDEKKSRNFILRQYQKRE